MEIVPSSESEVKTDNEHKILFKKPQIGLIIGPRKGKITAKVRSLECSSDIKAKGLVDALDNLATDLETKLDNSNVVGLNLSTEESCLKEAEKDSVKTIVDRKNNSKTGLSPAQQIAENIPIPYKEPKWGGCPEKRYSFEVLKSGKILENINLSTRSFFVFGRLANCDITLAHPTISRHHAVLQYRSEGSAENPQGFYIYDLESTHGTFLNKNKIKPNMYVRVHVGHILKFGCSTRLFVLQGPPEDEEEESDLTVSELKAKRQIELLQRMQNGEAVPTEESDGIDWGMGEDADEETDLAVNPFAATANEELYLDDPKKTLRGWFEREGAELEYDCEERGVAQFICRVELPIESVRGGVVTAEAIVHGKKKEAVVQCALEACRILDRYGLLRQATHESKKRKARDWESEDFYDSDEDTFLDRTGDVEQKRQARMRAAGRREVLTYQTLVEQHEKVLTELQDVEAQLRRETQKKKTARSAESDEEDELDAFMNNLSSGVQDKLLISKLKTSLTSLKAEEARLRKLVNVARPATLSELKPPSSETPATAAQTTADKMTAILGKARKHIRSKHGHAPTQKLSVGARVAKRGAEEDEEEEDDEEEDVVRGPTAKDDLKPVKSTAVPDSRAVERDLPSPPKNVPSSTKNLPSLEKHLLSSKEQKQQKEVKLDRVTTTDKTEKSRHEAINEDADTESSSKELSEKEMERRRKRNRKRMAQRNFKMRKESNTEWSNIDTSDPSVYSTWTPPMDQSGDGRTSLNEKLGY